MLAALALALTTIAGAACTSSSKSASVSSSPASRGSAQPPSGAATGGLSFDISGELNGSTDAPTTKVSRCTSLNGQFFLEATVPLGGTELDVTLTIAPDARIEIDDLAAGRSWSAPNENDPTATISATAQTATSGSVTASLSRGDAGATASGGSSGHLDVRGTFRC